MFCEKCGSPVEGEQKLCTKCAAEQAVPTEEQTAQEQPTAQEQEQAPQAAEAPENAAPAEDIFELNSADQAEPKKARKKGGLIAAVVAAVVVVACAIGLLLNWNSIKRTFQSPEEYFVDVEKSAIAEYSDELTQSYGELLNKFYENPEAVAHNAAETEISVTLGDELLTLLGSALEQKGMDMDVEWLRNIRLTLNGNVQGNTMEFVLAAALGENKLLSADVIMDSESNKVYAAVPELNEAFIVADVSSMMSAEDFQDAITQGNELSKKLADALPSEEVLGTLINTYTDIILSGIKNVEKQDDTITVNGVSQDVVVLTATVSEAELLEICQNILQKAQDDQMLENAFEKLSDFAEDYCVAYGIEFVGQKFSDLVDDAIESLEAARAEADSGNYLELKTYVNAKNDVCGRELALYEAGEVVSQPMSWLTAKDGDVTYSLVELDGISITGEKTKTKHNSEGFYSLYDSEEKIITLEFEVEEDVSTTLRLIPGDEMMNSILEDSAIPSALMSGNVALELSYGVNEAGKTYCDLSLLVGSKSLLTLSVNATTMVGDEIVIPAEAIDIMGEDGVSQWLSNVDLDNVVEALENANVPDSLLNILQTYGNLLKLQMG